MDEIQRNRKKLNFMIARCEAISHEFVQDDVLPLMESESAKDNAKRFFENRDKLFERTRKHVRDIEFKDMDSFEWAIRSLVLGLAKIRDAILREDAIKAKGFQFYEDFDNAINFTRKLPVLQKAKTSLTENRKTLQAIGATVTIVGGVSWYFIRMLLCV